MVFKQVEIEISKFKDFKRPKLKLEQYSTPPQVIKEFLVFIENDLLNLLEKSREKNEKVIIVDACAGTGFLALSIALYYYFMETNLDNFVFVFIEKDKEAVEILKENIKYFENNFSKLNYKIVNEDLFNIDSKEIRADFLVMNPPFGVQGKIKDKNFLNKALKLSNIVISFHTANSIKFLEKNFCLIDYIIVDYPIKQLFWFHNKNKKDIKVLIAKVSSKERCSNL
ncbi:MAG: methyltransferase [Nanoarchaeota archaeon]